MINMTSDNTHCLDESSEKNANRLELVPDEASVETVMSFLEGQMEEAEVPFKAMNKINIAIDEIYSNIVKYSHASLAIVQISISNSSVQLLFCDNGKPFDPLTTKEPDVDADAEHRNIGGLGIFLTRKLMSSVDYQYTDGLNQTVLTLNL